MAYRKRMTSSKKMMAKRQARATARKLYRNLKRKSKLSILKRFANFVGKTTYKKVSSMKKRFKRRGRSKRRRY